MQTLGPTPDLLHQNLWGWVQQSVCNSPPGDSDAKFENHHLQSPRGESAQRPTAFAGLWAMSGAAKARFPEASLDAGPYGPGQYEFMN